MLHHESNQVADLMSSVKPTSGMIESIEEEVIHTFLNQVTICNEFVANLRQLVM